MASFKAVVSKIYWILAAAGALYAVFLGLLMHPAVQRNALYAHRVQSQWLNNVSEPQTAGFAKNQVTPFYITTPDAERLYCWHILPLKIYIDHEAALSQAPSNVPIDDFTETIGFDLLSKDPESRLVINYHGNAGHVAQGFRTHTYHQITALEKTHVLTCDYRGFGLSSGSPTEAGLITDSITVASYALHNLSHPASRTVILGQSLGTAASTATTLYFLDPTTALLHSDIVHRSPIPPPTSFAGTVLVAPFTNLPSLLLTYRIGGLFPILGPLRVYPKILSFFASKIQDTWPSAARWQAAFATALSQKLPLNLQIVHARNDPDISFRQAEMLFDGIADVLKTGGLTTNEVNEDLVQSGVEGVRRGAWAYRRISDDVGEGVKRVVDLEITRTGGHNRIVSYAPVALAVNRAFVEAQQRN